MDDDELFDDVIFGPDSEGAVELLWEVATQCTEPRSDGSPCYSADSRQPSWDCVTCGGLGATYLPGLTIRALFRGQSKWKTQNASGEKALGDAQLTTPIDVEPQWRDDRIRDRFTVLVDDADATAGTVFYVAARAVPFNFAGAQRAWRVQLSSLDQTTRTRPQP